MKETKVRRQSLLLDHCKPDNMLQVLMERLALPTTELNENKKTMLATELQKLSVFMEKHPNSINFFRSDLLEWRAFLKQPKAYAEFFFNLKLQKTKTLMEKVATLLRFDKTQAGNSKSHTTSHYNGKLLLPPDVDRKAPLPTYYEILFRPGIRSIKEHPINEEHYGEHNQDIDKLHKFTTKLREEILFISTKKVPREMKKDLFSVLSSIVRISAYNVLNATTLIDPIRKLIDGLNEGDGGLEKKVEMVECMKRLTRKIEEHAKCHWISGMALERKMWGNITTIREHMKSKAKPTFELDLLAKSSFLKKEKLADQIQKGVANVSKEPSVASDEHLPSPTKMSMTETDQSVSSCPPVPPSTPVSEVFQIDSSTACLSCARYRDKYGDDVVSALKEKDGKFKIQVIPEVTDEPETLFKMKHVPKFEYALYKTIPLPTEPDLFDEITPLKSALRSMQMEEQGQLEDSFVQKLKNPYLYRKKLLKY